MGFWEKLFGTKNEDIADSAKARLHDDARRFAHLLVLEIKLNNEIEVYEGLRNGDLYKRLKKEIDRSRTVYAKRVAPIVAAEKDYFCEELVQTLADGDSSKLGPGWESPLGRS